MSVFTVYAGGINNAKEFIAFAKAVNKGGDTSTWRDERGIVYLNADIDMQKVKKWVSISSFKGTIDGKGHSLLNWNTKSAIIDTLATGGILRNIKIDSSCKMSVNTKRECVVSGTLVNVNQGIVENCENNAPIQYKGTFTTKPIYIGGLVGVNAFIVRKCRNNAPIDANCLIYSTNKNLNINIGGVVGCLIHKGNRFATIYDCENSGNIDYKGDVPKLHLGGIISYTGRGGIRRCVNRGDLSAEVIKGLPEARYYANIGGITAYSLQNIARCDNFGKITSEGIGTFYQGGIAGQTNGSVTMVDCHNYGNVWGAGVESSCIGGLLGVTGADVHICNATNRGNIRFNGTSCNKNSYLGGIAGYIFVRKNTKYSAYLRYCANYGNIDSDVEATSLNVGGILGRSRGTKAIPINIRSCENNGTISAQGCNVGNIVSSPAYTHISGEPFHNNIAKVSEPRGEKGTIYGRVTSTTGTPIVGVVVSDGRKCVQTDENGEYVIESNLTHARFVTISIPGDYKIPFRNSIPQNFRRIPRYAKAVEANFTLEKREKPVGKYTIAMIGDPQIKGLKVDSAAYRLRTAVYPDIRQLRDKKAATEDEFLAINLGDLIFNNMSKFDDYINLIEKSDIPMIHAIGNHDFDQTTLFDSTLGTQYFEEYLTPTYYSFNIGDIHYIIVNDISFRRTTPKQRYRLGLEYGQYKWLEQDLKYVSKDKTIVICGHAQLFSTFSTRGMVESKRNLNYKRYSELLSKYANVYSWSGHYHYNFGHDYAISGKNNALRNIRSICVARATGGLHCNRELNNDGTPNGYMVMEVDGNKVEWYYKSLGKERDYQMHIYSPLRTGSDLVKVNIWNYSPDYWSNVEWWENGRKVGTMKHKFEKDIAFLEDHREKGPFPLGKKRDDKARPYNAHGMFHIKPSEGVRAGEVRVTDNFGVTYTEKIEW